SLRRLGRGDCGRNVLVRPASVLPRRSVMKRTWVLSAIVVCGLAVAGVAAQRDTGAGQGAGRGAAGRGGGGGGGRIPPTGAIQHIKDNLYKVPGAGGNTTVFIRQDGV